MERRRKFILFFGFWEMKWHWFWQSKTIQLYDFDLFVFKLYFPWNHWELLVEYAMQYRILVSLMEELLMWLDGDKKFFLSTFSCSFEPLSSSFGTSKTDFSEENKIVALFMVTDAKMKTIWLLKVIKSL